MRINLTQEFIKLLFMANAIYSQIWQKKYHRKLSDIVRLISINALSIQEFFNNPINKIDGKLILLEEMLNTIHMFMKGKIRRGNVITMINKNRYKVHLIFDK